jgi:hypothetical protein
MKKLGQGWWFMPIIPAIRETEIGRCCVECSSGKKSTITISYNKLDMVGYTCNCSNARDRCRRITV